MPAPHRLSAAVLMSLPLLVHATTQVERSNDRSADSRTPSTVDSVRVLSNGDVTGVVVRMTRGGAISGRLVDADGAPVVGARVRTEDRNFWESPHWIACGFPDEATRREARTDEDGAFAFPSLRAWDYALVVEHERFPKHVVHDLHVVEGMELELGDTIVPRSASVVGVLRDREGRPAPQTEVHLMWKGRGVQHDLRAVTDALGRFRVDGLHPGRYRCRPTWRATDASCDPPEITVVADEVTPVELHAP